MRYHHTCLRMAETVTLTTASAGMNVEQQEFSFIVVGWNVTANLEESLPVSYKTDHSKWSCRCVPCYWSKWAENMSTQNLEQGCL